MSTPLLITLATVVVSIACVCLLVVTSEPVQRRYARSADEVARRAIEEFAREVGERVGGVVEPGTTPFVWWVQTRQGLHARLQLPEPYGRMYSAPKDDGQMAPPKVQLVWSGATWWPNDAVVRPPRRTYFEWRDGLPGEDADVTVGGRGYVVEEATAHQQAKLEGALAHAPCDGSLLIEGGTVSVFIDSTEAPNAAALAASMLGWQSYLSARWARGV